MTKPIRWAAALCCLGGSLQFARAQSWTLTSAPVGNWSCLASSADGMKLIACGGGAFVSTNGGISWAAASGGGSSIASSADGTRLVGVGSGIDLSNDSGATWTSIELEDTDWSLPVTPFAWSSVSCSADGMKILAASSYENLPFGFGIGYGPLFVSADAGLTWRVSITAFGLLGPVAVSADGTKMIVGEGGMLYRSLNSGAAWSQVATIDSIWTSLACSADGVRWVATSGTGIYASASAGSSWTLTSAPTDVAWVSVASSTDGTRLLAAAGTSLYSSTNSARTWQIEAAPANTWTAVAISADGNKLLAAAANGGIYTRQFAVNPSLTLLQTGAGAKLSWNVPSLPFALEQSADLSPTNWSEVTNLPVLNLKTFRLELTVPSPAKSNVFYRLKY